MPVVKGTKTTMQVDIPVMSRYKKDMEKTQKKQKLRKLVKQDFLVMLLDKWEREEL